MRCALVFYFVATIFVIVYSLPELCVFKDYLGRKRALCGKDDVKYTFDFIPPISQYISEITLVEQPLKQLRYNGFRNLSSQSNISTIVLQHCQISHVDAGALLNLHNLTIIDLSRNDINQIDSKLFSDTKQIEDIYMEFNKIEVLPNGLFKNLILLDVVRLEYNRIHQVENYSFKNTPSLRLIYLDNNQIAFMNMLFKDKFDNLTTLSLDGNPWKCNCELRPLIEFLTKINQLKLYEPVCENPPTLHGRKWSDISSGEFVCLPEYAISTQDSVMTSSEADDNIPVTVYNGTTYQPDDTDIPQPPSNQNWILYTILALVLVCVAAVIIGVVLLKRRSYRRTNSSNLDSGLPMRVVQCSAVSENNDSASNTANVDEESTSIYHYEMREATIN